ncbi:MAG: thiamine-phosphate kinase [Methanobacteriaceae archaeon]|nr:thiamine-phosphate kinase [Methanobacteriaceae archaeon]
MNSNIRLDKIKEKQLIQILLKKRNQKTPQLKQEIKTIKQSLQDDAALEQNNKDYTVLSTDMLLETTHFPKKMTYYQMGKKTVTVNLSDIIANGAYPKSLLLSMALPKKLKLSQFNELIDGILDQCNKYNTTLIGGDLNTSQEIILSATATGKINKEEVWLKTPVNENNLICITGKLGSPAAGFEILKNPEKYENIPKKQDIITSILEPEIPYERFKKLKKYPNLVKCCTDITDGLASELKELKDNNPGYGFDIYEDKIPYNLSIKTISKISKIPLENFLYHFGEEFELLLIIDEKIYENIKNDLNIYVIGSVNKTGIIYLHKKEKTIKLSTTGYEHF